MNHSIASKLPRTWQDINKLLDLTAASNWQLSSIKRYTSESRPSHSPLSSKPFSFHCMKVMTKLHCLMYFNLWNISKGESSLCAQGTKRHVIFHCAFAIPKINLVVVKQGYSYRVLGKSLNDLSCLQHSLPTWLSPSFALRQCCQVAVVHGM
jgi:hypothetical protein